MKILYAGSPDVSAIPLLHILEKAKHEVVGVLTNPPSAQGRSKSLVPTALAQSLLEKPEYQNIPILSPERLDADFRKVLESLKPDILLCFAYGKIFGPKFLALFPQGGINVHPSLLPKYRGCAPVPKAILNRDSETGVTIQKIALEMDCGDILAQERIPLDGTETAESLLRDAAERSSILVSEVLDKIENGEIKSIAQDPSKACYCAPFSKTDGLIDWACSALNIDAQIRAFSPWPGTYTYVDGKMLKVLKASVFSSTNKNEFFNENNKVTKSGSVLGKDMEKGILVQTGEGILALEQLQWHTKKAMGWKDFLNGSKGFLTAVCSDK